MARRKPTVAVINSSDEVLEILGEALELRGYSTVTAHIDDIRRGRRDLLQLLRDHDPAVIIWDIAPPYVENWRFLELIRRVDVMQGRRIIVTTTNRAAVEAKLGVRDVLEILDRPFGIDELLAQVGDDEREPSPPDR